MVEVIDCVLTGVLIGFLTMSSRSGIGWRVSTDDRHALRIIDPEDPSKMSLWLA